MAEFLNKLIPNIMDKPGELGEACWQTLYMMLIVGVISIILGLFFGVILMITAPDGLHPNRPVHFILDKIVNFFRSVPFIILITLLLGLSRLIMGTGIGPNGAIIPLIIGTVPFYSRQVELALAEVDRGLVEAARAMGCSPWEIITRVYLKEAIPGLIRGTTITMISLIGLTAMAGAVGAGGLGDFAIRYGHGRRQTDVSIVVIIIIYLLVTIIQAAGEHFVKKSRH